MFFTISISHTFADAMVLQQFLADFAPIASRYPELPHGALPRPVAQMPALAAPVKPNTAAAPAAVDAINTASAEAPAAAVTNEAATPAAEPPKRKRRTPEQIAADNAADAVRADAAAVAAEMAPAAPAQTAVAVPPAVQPVAPTLPAPVSSAFSLQDLQKKFIDCTRVVEGRKPGSSRNMMTDLCKAMNVEAMRMLPAERAGAASEVLDSLVAAVLNTATA